MEAIHESVVLNEPCPSGGTHEVFYADTFRARHSVHREIRCERCGDVSAANYAELPSEEVRQAILVKHGAWEAHIAPSARLKAISAVRELLALSLDDARARVTPGSPVIRGTHAEAASFANELAKRGVDPRGLSLVQAGGGPAASA